MLGEQLKKLRKAYGISQVELATKLNVSKQSISNWENNNIMPSIDMLKKICAFFACSSDFMLEINNGENLFIEASGLNLDQMAHIQQTVNDLRMLNEMIEKNSRKHQ